MADHFLRLAVKSLETLYRQLTSRANDEPDILSSKADVEKDLLRILSCQAESAIAQGNNQEAIVFIERCKDILLRLPNETAYLSVVCYNFGIEAYNLTKFEDSVFWLSQSYDIGKANMKYGPGSEALAKVLRLLATCYLEWDCEKFQEKALNTVSLANKVGPEQIRLHHKPVFSGLNEMLESKVSLDMCLNTVRLLMSENREVLAFEYLKTVCQHFESSPSLGTALVLHIELLLQRGKVLLSRQKIEDVITGHYTGKQLAPEALTSLHIILWDQASKHYEDDNYSEALQWYDYSLSFFKAGQMDQNLSKLQRNRASCFLKLKQLEKAKEAAKEAERSDPDSIFTQFIVYKIAVQESNLSQLCPPDRTLLVAQRTCLLMAADASLELYRKSPHSAQTEELTQTLESIQTCWEVWKTLKASGSSPKDPTETMLLLYEFEARAKLNDPKVETILESVLELETVETKVLESMAALAMEPPAHYPLLCKKALKASLSLHKKQPQADLAHCSKCVHTLIKLSLPRGVSEVGPQVLHEVWDYFQEALSIIAAAVSQHQSQADIPRLPPAELHPAI
uniref:Protein ZIP4 homolog n=1 Tax=Oryzias sinensis TaxID=183150 RepID=A0A8C8DN70_9TELE